MVAFSSATDVVAVKPPNYHMNRKEMDSVADRSVLIGSLMWSVAPGQRLLQRSCLLSAMLLLLPPSESGQANGQISVQCRNMPNEFSQCMRVPPTTVKHIPLVSLLLCSLSSLLFCALPVFLSFFLSIGVNRVGAVTVPGIRAKLPVASLW